MYKREKRGKVGAPVPHARKDKWNGNIR